MNKVIEEILTTRKTVSPEGAEIRLHSEISPGAGKFLQDHISGLGSVKKTLEVGCAYGLSSLFICEALQESHPGAKHIIIDPLQSKDWQNAGVHALERAGFDNFELIEKPSETALPALLEDHEGTFDLIFLDGFHTFDHTMLDCFYATRLLRSGGILIIDDYDFAPVAKVVKYISQYPCYRKKAKITDWPQSPLFKALSQMASLIPVTNDMRFFLPRSLRRLIRRPNLISLEKISADNRAYWYRPF